MSLPAAELEIYNLLFGLDFYIVLGPSTEIIGAETIAENQENTLYK